LLKYIPLILFGVTLNAIAQLLLKKGMTTIGHFAFSGGEILKIAPTVALNPYVVGGLFSYVLSVGLWMLVLSRVDVSAAYPFLSIGYIIAAFGGWLFFAEDLSLARMVGIALICIGVVFVARS
jgi:multidrug transporter EmrE-like cation transporter